MQKYQYNSDGCQQNVSALCLSVFSVVYLFFITEDTEERRGIVFTKPVHSIVTLSKMRLYFDRLWNQSLSSMLMIQVIIQWWFLF